MLLKNKNKKSFTKLTNFDPDNNMQAKPTGASWWNAECENAKIMFRQAHRRDSINIHAVGALHISAETLALRNTYRKVKNKSTDSS